MNRTVYSGLSYLLAPLALGRLYYLSGRHQGYRQNIRQRFGYIDAETAGQAPVLWLHAVSVGEVIASESFVKALLSEYPQLRICVTTMTPTGAEQVVRSFSEAMGFARLQHCYAPYDLPCSVCRFLDKLKPVGLVIMETELWPNWIAETTKRRLPSILVNGRLSEKSARGYRKIGSLSRQMLGSLDLISAQTEVDAARFKELGAQKVEVSGNLKADFELTDQETTQASQITSLLGLQADTRVLIAASTHPGEDETVLDAFSEVLKTFPDLKLFLVPRHPERTPDIEQMAKQRGIQYRLRSEALPQDDYPLLICDLLGELRALYGLANIALMGGTLIDHGGHNPLEPAAWSLPLIAGPSQRNFDLAFHGLEQAGAMLRAQPDSHSIAEKITALLSDETHLRSMGDASFGYLDQNRGATETSIKLFAELFGPSL